MLWSDKFQCRIPHIDAQHRALFDQLERLGDVRLAAERIPETIGFLEVYVREHFADEESLQGQSGYPDAVRHQRQHRELVAEVTDFRRQYEESGADLPTLMDVNRVVANWLKQHILSSDKDFSVFYHTLPDERKRAFRLPLRPWIPESSQTFYEELIDSKANEATAPSPVAGIGGYVPSRVERRGTAMWTDSLLCGIPAMDEQHRELFLQLDILRDGRDKHQVAKVLWFLSDYLIKHFADEEMLQLKSGYPRTARHRGIHADFIKTVTDMRKKLEQSSDSRQVALEINRAVCGWLREHILTEDKEFGRYFIAREHVSNR